MTARVLALLAVALSSAAVAAPVPKQPTAKWVVNFADAQCIATRNYGTDSDPLYLVLKAPPSGNVVQIAVVRKGSKSEPAQADGEIIFDQGPAIRASLLEFGVQKLDQRALMTNLASGYFAQMRQATSIRIHVRESGFTKIGTRLQVASMRADESFVLSQVPAVMNALDACTADLRKVWNVWDDKENAPTLKRPPSSNIRSVFNPEDYPFMALLDGQTGGVSVVLLIDERGKLADCTVVETSGVAALDAQSCAIIKERGKFTPAIGLDGKPAKSTYVAPPIVWRLAN